MDSIFSSHHQSCLITSNRSLGLSSVSTAGAGVGGLYGSLVGLDAGGGVCSIARASLGSRSGGAEHCEDARPTSSSVSVRSLSVPTVS